MTQAVYRRTRRIIEEFNPDLIIGTHTFAVNIVDKLKENGPTLIPYNPGYLKCEVTQVKEKFGGLRFYVDCNDDYIDGLISLAEGMSYNTCSECGETGEIS